MECHKSLTAKREKSLREVLYSIFLVGGRETISCYTLTGWSISLPFCVQIKLTLLCLFVSSDSRACSPSLMVVIQAAVEPKPLISPNTSTAAPSSTHRYTSDSVSKNTAILQFRQKYNQTSLMCFRV